MAGNCWICNPICSRCKPPIYKAVDCDECGYTSIFRKAEIISDKPLLCEKCKHDLTKSARPKVIKCRFKEVLCAYPCDKAHAKVRDDSDAPCKLNTPPSKAWLQQHPKAAALNGF